MATTIIKSATSDNQALVDSSGQLLVTGGVVNNSSIGSNNGQPATKSTLIAGISPANTQVPITVQNDGSVNVTVDSGSVTSIPGGTVDTAFGDVSGVASGILTTLVTYTAGGPTRVQFCEVSGTNIATYTVLYNGAVVNKKQTFYGYLDNDFQFSKGFQMQATDTFSIQVIQNNNNTGEFSGFILVLKDY